MRSEAAYTLSRLGSTDERVMSAFLSHLENTSSDSRWKSRSARALSRAGQNSDKVLSALLLNLNHKDPLVCVSAALALCDLWRPDERSVNVLFSCLDDESSSVRSIAVEALSKLGKTTDWIMPLLVQWIWIEQHQDETCVGAGIDALWAIVEGEG